MNGKNVGTRVKKMYIWAIVAIAAILILNVVNWATILSNYNEVSAAWTEHKYDRDHSDYYYGEECSTCESYRATLANYTAQSVSLWRVAIFECALIALCGAICYAVGAMLEAKLAFAARVPCPPPQPMPPYPPAYGTAQPPQAAPPSYGNPQPPQGGAYTPNPQ